MTIRHLAVKLSLLSSMALAVACSSDSKKPPAGDAATTSDASDAGSTTNLNCDQLWRCAWACSTDDCIDECRSRGAPTARALLDTVLSCVTDRGGCTSRTDFTCGCEQSCYPDGACEAELMACSEASGAPNTDVACEVCH